MGLPLGAANLKRLVNTALFPDLVHNHQAAPFPEMGSAQLSVDQFWLLCSQHESSRPVRLRYF